VLTLVVYTFTRECLALEVDSCLPSRRATRALDKIIFERGRPESIRVDNGSELTSPHFLANGKLRDECLNIRWFVNLQESTAAHPALAPRI